jgi:hypothetical protein
MIDGHASPHPPQFLARAEALALALAYSAPENERKLLRYLFLYSQRVVVFCDA